MSAGGGGNENKGDSLRSGQAKRAPTSPIPESTAKESALSNDPVKINPTTPTTTNGDNFALPADTPSETSKVVDETIDKAVTELTKTEVTELQAEEGAVTSTWKRMSDTVKSGLSKLFGGADSPVTEQDIKEVVEEVQKEVEQEQKQEIAQLNVVAEDVVDTKTGELESVAEADEDSSIKPEDIKEDLTQVKVAAEKEIKEEIKDAGDEIKDQVEEKLLQIESKVIKEKLEKKYGDKVKVKVTGKKIELVSNTEGTESGKDEEGPAIKKKKASKKKKKVVDEESEEVDVVEKVERTASSGDDEVVEEKPKKKKKKKVVVDEESQSDETASESASDESEPAPKKKASKKKKKKAVVVNEEETNKSEGMF